MMLGQTQDDATIPKICRYMISKKELYKPWILIPVSSKSVEKWGSCGRLKNSI